MGITPGMIPSNLVERIEFRASENPRVDPDFLAGERIAMGPLWFAQEYEVLFLATENQTDSTESIEAAFSDDTVLPMFD